MLQVTVESPVRDSFRVRQVAGMFDLPVMDRCTESFQAEVPDLSERWDIGVIVGPSGSGKTTIAKAAFGDAVLHPTPWPEDKAIIDCFGDLPIKQITRALTSVGFSSPPSWLKPFAALSNGEKFRCELAGALLRIAGVRGQGSGVREEAGSSPSLLSLTPDPCPLTPASFLTPDPCPLTPASSLTPDPSPPTPLLVFDEFTSVVDRTVAKIGSAAVAKWIRSRSQSVRFVAVTCHYDVVRWLQPDWVLDMSGASLSRGRVRQAHRGHVRQAHRGRVRRPPIALRIWRVERATWNAFKRHHYLSGSLHRSSICFLGTVDDRPACFTAALPFPHPTRPGWREHRTVCLPDFQGVGLGTAMSEFVASLFVATGKPYFSTTSHPAMIRHRAGSPLWRMHRRPRMVSRHAISSGLTTAMSDTCSRGRNTAGFEYVGPARMKDARAFGIA